MARKISKEPLHGLSKYPWTEWEDGAWREATKGKDFKCLTSSFRTTLHIRAVKVGMDVVTRVNKNTVSFQFRKKTEETKNAVVKRKNKAR